MSPKPLKPPCVSPAAIRAARGERTQREVAAAAGIDQQLFARIERGESPNVGAPTLAKIARAMGVTMDDLME
jgi:transcriptional regulator with XRE-family HTH domain